MATTKPVKMSEQGAHAASYSELLAQARWAKDEGGALHRVRDLDQPGLLRLLAYLEELAPALAAVKAPRLVEVWPGTEEAELLARWLRASPLYRAVLTRVMATVTDLPRKALIELTGRPTEGRHVMAGEGGFFVGTTEDLACYVHMLAHHDHDTTDPEEGDAHVAL